MSLGNRLKMARKAAKLTQKALGNMVGVSPSAIANYETGVSYPNEDILINLMNKLNIDANYLYADDIIKSDNIYFLSPEEEHLISMFRGLNFNGQQMVITTVESYSVNPSLADAETAGVS